MKYILTFIFVLSLGVAFGQGVRPDQFPEDTTPHGNDGFYTQEQSDNGQPTARKILLKTLKTYYAADSINITPTGLEILTEDGAGGYDVTSSCTAAEVISEWELAVTTGLSTNYLPRWSGTTLINSQVHDNGSSVGVGTDGAVGKLGVKRGAAQLDIDTGADHVYFEAINRADVSAPVDIRYYARSTGNHVFYNGSYSERMRLSSTGLNIVNDLSVSGASLSNAGRQNSLSSFAVAGSVGSFAVGATGNEVLFTRSGANYISAINTGGSLRYEVNGTHNFFVGSTNLLSGTNVLTLSANGASVAGDVSVTGGSFIDDGTALSVPDYVFEDDYDLPCIEEHAQFMSEEKHLPKVTPAREINGAKGYNMAERREQILEELETAHLYIVQLNDRIKALEARIDAK